MLSRSSSRPKKAARRVAPRVLSLEARYLLSADLAAIAGQIAVPLAMVSPTSTPSGPSAIGPDVNGPAVSGPYTPAQIRHAYGVDQLGYTGAGQTIAIVDAYDASTIAGDLATFDNLYSLPAANLVKVSQTGSTTKLPSGDTGWGLEVALDVEWAHAIAPGATILLVEANSASESDLLTAVKYAATQATYPVAQVSMSWGGGEFSGQSGYDSYFQAPGVSYFASAGDSGEAVDFPAVSPYVTGVGGTTISLDQAGDKLSETSWSGSGGGVSADTGRPSFQDGFEAAGGRGVPDVSYDANPSSGVAVIDSAYFGNSNPRGVGGTSAGSPQWAGLMALANQGRAAAGLSTVATGQTYGTNSALYALAGPGTYTNAGGDYTDITSGSNGVSAAAGYDNVTGLGSPVANNLIPALVGKAATSASSATFVGSDSTTGGTWSGAYGVDGYEVIGGTTSLPSYATVTPAGQSSYTWAASTADPTAPQVSTGSASRVASTWYSATSFNVALSLPTAQAHQVSAYLLDWQGQGRTERVDVLDAATGAVLSTQTASSFGGGEYLTWNLTGNVMLRFTDLSGPNAVLEGLFFGAGGASKSSSSATFVGSDSTTGGTWSGAYGVDGYEVIGGTTSLPSYATVTPAGQQSFTWAASTADPTAPQVSTGSASRVASTWYSATSFNVALSLPTAQAHQVSAYLLDWQGQGRTERVDVLDAATGAVLSTQTASSFGGGEYLTWNLTGNVMLRFTDLSGPNAVLEGLFFGAGGASKSSSSATFVGSDSTTGGTWSGAYGVDGYEVIGGTTSLPSYATVTPAGQQSFTWAASTADTRAPQVATGSASRVAATYYSPTSFTVALGLPAGQAHQVSAYLLDWDSAGRSERVDVLDAATGTLLSTQTASSFAGGEYLTWSLTGNVMLRFTDLSGPNAVLEGLFFGAGGASKSSSSATFVGSDSTTQGTWTGTYGSAGYDVVGGSSSLPSSATVALAGQQSFTWAGATADTRALQTTPGSSSRVAATYYSPTSFTVALSLTDGQAHKISAYLLDWDSAGRSEEVDVLDATTGTVLNTQTVSSFAGGDYLTWTITGNVTLRFTDLSGPNAVLEGLFFS